MAGEGALNETPNEKSSLAGVAARGGMIIGVVGVIENGSQFLRALILARILSPSDFGLVGMAFVFLQAGESLSQTGFYRAIVQKRGDSEPYLDTVWLISVLRGAFLFGLMFALAPLVGAFFATPQAVAIVHAVAPVFLISGLQNPAMFLLEKELAFKRYSVPRVAGVIVDLVTAVVLAIVLRNVWSMVIGFLAGKIVHVAASYIVKPFRPRFTLNRELAAEFYGYGRHIFRFTAVDYLVSQADRAIVGHLLGPAPLGLYSFASRLAGLPSQGLYTMVLRVAFPLFSRIQEDAARLKAGFVRALSLMAIMSAPISAGVWTVTPDLVRIFFGSKWEGMVPSCRVLCISAVFTSLYYTLGAIMGGVGRPDLTARGSYVFLGLMAGPIYPMIHVWGILGAAWCVTLSSCTAFCYLIAAGSRSVGCDLRVVLRALVPPVVASIAMAEVLTVTLAWVGSPAGLLPLALEIGAGAILYVLFAAALDQLLKTGMLTYIRTAWRPV
jgi:O-antigen/teichoic acid export membrane protein